MTGRVTHSGSIIMLYLRTFGGLVLESAGRPVTGPAGQRRRLALLAVLALAGARGVSRDKLLVLFWPESTQARARGALNQLLYALRCALGDIFQEIGDLRLDATAIGSDVSDFNAALARGSLVEAAAMYPGVFLDGVHLGSDLREFDMWADEQRRDLSRRYATCLKALAQEADRRNALDEVVEWRRKLASADPLNGAAALAYMHSLAATGNATGALDHARLFDRLLNVELGAAADDRVKAFAAALREGKVTDTRRIPLSQSLSASSPIATPAGGLDNSVDEAVPSPSPHASGVIALQGEGSPRVSAPSFLAAAVIVGLFAISAAVAFRVPGESRDARGVVLVVSSDEGALPAAARERVESDLTSAVSDSRLLDVHRADQNFRDPPAAIARRLHVPYALVATLAPVSQHGADSIRVRVQLVDALSGTVLASTPSSVLYTAPTSDTRLFQSYIRALLAQRLDRRFASWAYASNMPRTHEAVQQLADGIDAFVRGERTTAHGHVREAAALDTLSATPLVWSAFAAAFYKDTSTALSTIKSLRGSARTLRAFDRALLDVVAASIGSDLVASIEASRRLAEVVPNSEWEFLVARDAILLLRTHEAIRILRSLGPHHGWMRQWSVYWSSLSNALHLEGRYDEELAEARSGLRDLPDDRKVMQLEVRALAALGRDHEVEVRCADAARYRQRPDWDEAQPMDQAISELAAHGRRAAALRLLEQREKDYRGATASDRDRLASLLGHELLAVGRASDARALLEPLARRPVLVDQTDLKDLGVAAALQGDKRLADSVVAVLSRGNEGGHSSGTEFAQARIAAALGDRPRAIGLLQAAFRNGFRFPTVVHQSGFASFWSDPRLQAVMRRPDNDR